MHADCEVESNKMIEIGVALTMFIAFLHAYLQFALSLLRLVYKNPLSRFSMRWLLPLTDWGYIRLGFRGAGFRFRD